VQEYGNLAKQPDRGEEWNGVRSKLSLFQGYIVRALKVLLDDLLGAEGCAKMHTKAYF
jgi:hypothetical protein